VLYTDRIRKILRLDGLERLQPNRLTTYTMATPQILMPEIISSLSEIEGVGINWLKNF
jgi:hypothetical protein